MPYSQNPPNSRHQFALTHTHTLPPVAALKHSLKFSIATFKTLQSICLSGKHFQSDCTKKTYDRLFRMMSHTYTHTTQNVINFYGCAYDVKFKCILTFQRNGSTKATPNEWLVCVCVWQKQCHGNLGNPKPLHQK